MGQNKNHQRSIDEMRYQVIREQIQKYKSPDSGNFHLINKCAKKVAFCDDEELDFENTTIQKSIDETRYQVIREQIQKYIFVI